MSMTERYRASDPISDLISDDYRMLQVISRFGLTLGFGDQSVVAACKAHPQIHRDGADTGKAMRAFLFGGTDEKSHLPGMDSEG